jgi:hypothetical protein
MYKQLKIEISLGTNIVWPTKSGHFEQEVQLLAIFSNK